MPALQCQNRFVPPRVPTWCFSSSIFQVKVFFYIFILFLRETFADDLLVLTPFFLPRPVATDSGVSVWGGAPFASSGWQELRVVVPAAVSTLTLLLTLTTVFVCLKKSKNDVWLWRT